MALLVVSRFIDISANMSLGAKRATDCDVPPPPVTTSIMSSKPSFLFVSLPPEGQEKSLVYQNLKSKVVNGSNPYGEISNFPIPQFKVLLWHFLAINCQIGTLDTLVVLSEDLAKFDGQFEGNTNKIIDVLRTAFKGDEARVDNACRIADRISINELKLI